MTVTLHAAALAELRGLAHGLPLGDVHRLLERVAQADAAEELRAALLFLGAAALLGEFQAYEDGLLGRSDAKREETADPFGREGLR